MWWPRLVAMIVVGAVSGCSWGDKSEPTKLEPLAHNEFEFQAPDDNPLSENDRIAQLEKYLADNGLCPNGYTIKEKFPIVAKDDPLGQKHVMVYHGVCKNA